MLIRGDFTASCRSGEVMRSVAVVVSLILLGSACTGVERSDSTTESVSIEDTASTEKTVTDEPGDAEDQPEQVPLPDGPLYAPAALPEDWRVQSMVLFGSDHRPDEDSALFVAHRTNGGYELGGLTLVVRSYPTSAEATEAASTSIVGFLDGAPIDVAGIDGALLAEEAANEFRSLRGVAGEVHAVELFGSLPLTDFEAVAAALDFGEPQPVLAPALENWQLVPLGDGGDAYELGLAGPTGTLSIFVAPGTTEAALYRSGGPDFEFELTGEQGSGFYAVQRIESEGLEFPSIEWWVPNVHLSASTGIDHDLIVEILDSFVEVDRADFAELLADAAVDVLDGDESGDPPVDGAPDGVPLDPELEAKLVAYIESRLGRTFDDVPEVTIVDRRALQASVPEGAFVSEELWDTLLTLELVDPTDDRLAADAVRREQVRGVCCPVSVVDTGDPLFNEVVLVHELTHGLDTEIDLGGGGSGEPLEPAIALIEGNAHRVAFEYADVLREEGADLPDPPSVFPPGGDPRLPPVVQEILEFPYDEGRRFAAALVAAGGEQAIVEAFGRPPTTSEHILDVEAYLTDEQPTTVDQPSVPDSAGVDHQGSLGAHLVQLLVEPEIGNDAALDLALAWAGDRYRRYEQDGSRCISAMVEFDTEAYARTFETSLGIEGADVSRTDRAVAIVNCVAIDE